MVDTENTAFDDDWRTRYARMQDRLQRTDEIQKKWRENPIHPATLVDVAKALCDRDAPPPTDGELRWLKDNLVEHQRSVERLIALIETLLDRTESASSYSANPDDASSPNTTV